MSAVVRLDDPAAADPRVCGPKMASLARLRSWGLDVPAGFTVPVAAFWAFWDSNDLAGQLRPILAGCDPDDGRDLEARAARARRLVEASPMPEAVAAEVRRTHDDMFGGRNGGGTDCGIDCGIDGDGGGMGGDSTASGGSPPLAVRSSAVAEDSGDASFAGQFSTELGVVGPSAVAESVRRCWASMWAPRALAYRLRAGISLKDCPMAVGVLRLVRAHASGVSFSRDPVTANPERQLIEATFGLGEPLVSGRVTPDRVEVDNDDLRILDYRVSAKEVVSRFEPAAGRVVEAAMPEALRERRVLSDDDVRAVAAASRLVEQRWGRPVDVEWVIEQAGAGVTLVQARPQTVAAAPPTAEGGFLGQVLAGAFGIDPTATTGQDRRREERP